MFGCCSCFRSEISRIAVDGMPSSSASRLSRDNHDSADDGERLRGGRSAQRPAARSRLRLALLHLSLPSSPPLSDRIFLSASSSPVFLSFAL